MHHETERLASDVRRQTEMKKLADILDTILTEVEWIELIEEIKEKHPDQSGERND